MNATVTTTTFTDTKGRTWDVSLTMGAARRVERSDFSEITDRKVSILKIDRDLFMSLLSDGPLAMAVVWAIIQPQVQEVLMELPEDQREEEFLDALDGPAVEAAREALWGALIGFFPEHRTALSTCRTKWKKAVDRVGRSLEELDPDLQKMIDEELDLHLADLKIEVQKELGSIRKKRDRKKRNQTLAAKNRRTPGGKSSES